MNSLRMSFWIVPASCARLHALLLGRDDVERHDRQHGAVHGHRDRHLVERDLVEEDLHVLDRVDGHAGLADVAHHALVVGVVAAMRRQVEGDRQPLLARGEVAPVEGVGLLGGGEAGVLPDRPRPQRVHRRVRPAQERRQPGGVVQVLEARRGPPRCRRGFTGICSAASHSARSGAAADGEAVQPGRTGSS